jgi:Flp pilus assembly protein TadD
MLHRIPTPRPPSIQPYNEIRMNQDYYSALSAQAREHHRAGRLSEAEAIYRRMLKNEPYDAQLVLSLGLLMLQAGDALSAVNVLTRAVHLQPANPAAHGNLGMAYKQLGRFDDMVNSFRKASELCPNLPQAHFNVAAALEESGRWQEAIEPYRKAIDLEPHFPQALTNLSFLCCKCGNITEAADLARRAVALRPGDVVPHRRLGTALLLQGSLDEALSHLRQAVEIGPPDAETSYNLGVAHMEKGQCGPAIAAYQQALALKPRYGEAAWNLALTYLKCGDFRQGWRMYESRWSMKERFFHHDLAEPLWDGRPLNGQRIFVHVEQGFGDVIQMARLIPMVQQRGGRVIFECTRELYPLMADLPGAEKVIALGDSIPEFDVHCPLLSLPGRLDIRLDNIPNHVPYLRANPATVDKWRQHFAGEKRLKVGLVWSGRPSPPHRSINPGLFQQLTDIEGGGVASTAFRNLTRVTRDYGCRQM